MPLVIETDCQGAECTKISNHVLSDARLSAEALGVLVWLSQFPQGQTLSQSDIFKRFGIGEDKWQRIRKELVAVGVIETSA